MSYREYLKKQYNNKSITDPSLLNEQQKLIEGKAKIIKIVVQQRQSLSESIEAYTGIMSEYQQMRTIDSKLLNQL
jgi:hypothetical protein